MGQVSIFQVSAAFCNRSGLWGKARAIHSTQRLGNTKSPVSVRMYVVPSPLKTSRLSHLDLCLEKNVLSMRKNPSLILIKKNIICPDECPIQATHCWRTLCFSL